MKFYCTIFLTLASTLLSITTTAKTSHPNIVFVLADDMGYDSVAALNPESNALQTPNIDRLLEQGMHFTDGHANSSVCTPSRYGILTGRYSWRSKLKRQVLWGYGMPLIEEDRLTLPAMLHQQGYYTGCIGKWHLGMGWRKKDGTFANTELLIGDKIWTKNKAMLKRMHGCEDSIDFTQPVSGPCDRGFDYYFGMDLPNMAPYVWIENDHILQIPTMQKPKNIFGDDGIMYPEFRSEDILPRLSERASRWITEASRKKQPFFLYLSLTSPHTPVAPAKEFIGKTKLGKYGDYVYQTDWVVGQAMAAVKKAGIENNTIFIFTTDNGTAGRFGGKKADKPNMNYHFRGKKLSIYEGGHRLPLIVRWPGKTKPNTQCDQTVCLNDFMATFAELTGYKLPVNAAEDSYSILPLLTGKATKLPNHPNIINQDYSGTLAIRQGPWKLILKGKKLELYNLDEDLNEKHNITDQHPELTQKLFADLKRSVEKGRTTRGLEQPNYKNKSSWAPLPW